MSYQPEERYWTDYLRIALPVVGLLLMLGLFWFWAASLIGDEDDDDPNNLAAVATATAPAPSPSPSPPPATESAGNQGDDSTGDETQPAADDGNDETDADGDNQGNATDENDQNSADDETNGNQASDDENTDANDEAPECDPGDFCVGALAVVNTDVLNVRAEPILDDSNIQGQFVQGDQVEITGEPEESEDLEWVQVEGTNADGEDLEGYVTTQYLEVE